jgi:hypothetical protein
MEREVVDGVAVDQKPQTRLEYHPPVVTQRGDVRDLTRAGFGSGADLPMTGFLTPSS